MRLKTQNTCKCRLSDPRWKIWKNLFLQEDCSITACCSSYASPSATLVLITGRRAGNKTRLDGLAFLHVQNCYNTCLGLNSSGSWKVNLEQGGRWPAQLLLLSLLCPLRVTVLQPLCPALAVLREHQEEDTSLSLCCLPCCKDQWVMPWCLQRTQGPQSIG